jgi:hypothetical protein
MTEASIPQVRGKRADLRALWIGIAVSLLLTGAMGEG